MKVSESFARSSVSSAVISFVVDAIERRSSGLVAQATAPVETSITIALGASTGQRGGRSAAPAADGASAAASRASASARAGAHCGIRIRWPGASSCGSRSGLAFSSCSSETPVFSAMPDGVSPGLTT